MDKFKTLFMMQLKEKIDLSFLKSKKQTMFKVVFSVLGFIVITVVAYFLLYLCQMLNLFSALNHIPLSVMTVILTLMFFLNLFTCTVGLSKTLFYGKDNLVLITYPVKPFIMFLSKMLVFYINEIKKAFTFLIPVFFAYGLISNFSFIYFILMPIMLVIFASIPVLIGGLLAVPTNYIIAFLKKFPIIKILLLCVLLGGVITIVIFAIRMIPADINLISSWTSVSKSIRTFLAWFASAFYPFYAFTIFLCGKYQNLTSTLFTEYSYIVLLVMLAVIAVLIGLNLLVSKFLYLKLASRQFEFNQGRKKIGNKNIPHKTFISASVYEFKRCVRDTGILSSAVATLIVTPIAILLLNAIYSAINTRILGDYLTISFNVLIILLFVLSNNINVSSIYSRDGDALYLNKTKPNKPYQILFPRLCFNVVVTTVVVAVASGFFLAKSTLGVFDGIFLFFTLLFVALTHIVWSAEIDFLNPKQNIFKTEGMAGVNPNELKSTILAFSLSAICFVIVLGFQYLSANYIWLKLFVASLGLLAWRVYSFYYKSKVLFKEI